MYSSKAWKAGVALHCIAGIMCLRHTEKKGRNSDGYCNDICIAERNKIAF